MQINVNLASQKYEDVRQFYIRWGVAFAMAVVLTALLAVAGWFTYKNTASDRKEMNEWRDKIARLDQQRKDAEAILNKPENRDVRDQSLFWNGVIDEKSFSWIQLFSDLEKIMPARAHLMQVQPTLTPEKTLKLKLTVASENHDYAMDLLSRMERSDHFHNATITSENVRAQNSSGQGFGPGSQTFVEVGIECYYTPASHTQPARSTAKEGM